MSIEKLRQNIKVYWKTAHPTLELDEDSEVAVCHTHVQTII